MLIRRWGILWKALKYAHKTCITIVNVCAKLHNFIIDCSSHEQETVTDANELVEAATDSFIFMRRGQTEESRLEEPQANDEVPDDDAEILKVLSNQFKDRTDRDTIRLRFVENSTDIRVRLTYHIRNCGFVFDSLADNDFTLQ